MATRLSRLLGALASLSPSGELGDGMLAQLQEDGRGVGAHRFEIYSHKGQIVGEIIVGPGWDPADVNDLLRGRYQVTAVRL